MSSSGVPGRKVPFWKPQKENSGLVVLIKIEGAFPLGCIVYLHTVTHYLGYPSLNYEKRYFYIPGAGCTVDPQMPHNGAWDLGDASLRDFSVWYTFTNETLVLI